MELHSQGRFRLTLQAINCLFRDNLMRQDMTIATCIPLRPPTSASDFSSPAETASLEDLIGCGFARYRNHFPLQPAQTPRALNARLRSFPILL